MKQKDLAVWLKISISMAFAIVFFLAFIVVPGVASDLAREKAHYAHLASPFTWFVWLSVAPAFLSMALAWMVFTEMGRDNSFCEENARRLKYISGLGLLEAAYYFVGLILLLLLNLLYVPILVSVAVIISICFLVTVSAAALSHLVMKAWLIKSENDLTV
jgi:hypothetical protein